MNIQVERVMGGFMVAVIGVGWILFAVGCVVLSPLWFPLWVLGYATEPKDYAAKRRA